MASRLEWGKWGAVAIGGVVGFVWIILKCRSVRRDELLEEDELLLFGGVDGASSVDSRKRLVELLSNAQRSLDACVYSVSAQDLTEELAKAGQRGVKVRLILDHDMIGNASCAFKLQDYGVKVRSYAKQDKLMHHKFCIVDGKRVLTGSLNWTKQALHDNWEHVLVSNRPEQVRLFQNAFEYLWINFRPFVLD